MAEEEIGTLIVVVLKAQNLHDKHFFKQDVYAQITFNGETKKTKVDVKGGQHPMWDEELRFPVYKIPNNGDIKKYRELTAGCWAKEHKDDTFLGEGKVDMTPTLKSGEFDEWIPLKTPEDQRGDIYLEITYYSNAPVPVRQASIPPAQQPSQKPQTQTQPHPSSQQPHSQPLLAVPNYLTNSTLGRRPSKLSPKERLSRGPLPGSLTPGPGPAAGSAGSAPSTLTPGPGLRVSPKQQAQGLPAPAVSQQSQVGLGARSSTPAVAAAAAAAPAVPSILRPGNPHADPHASVRAHPSRSASGSRSPPSHQPQSPSASHYPNPYEAAPAHTHAHTPNPYEASSTHRHTPNPYEVASTPNPYVSSAQASSIPFASTSSAPTPAPGPTPGPGHSNGTGTLPYPGTTYTPLPTQPHRHPSNPPVGGPGVLDWNSAQQGGQISFPVPNFPVPGGLGGVPTVADNGNNGYSGVGGSGYGGENTNYNGSPTPQNHIHQRTTSHAHPPPNSPPYSHQPSFFPSQGPSYSPHPHSHPNRTASSSDKETLPDPYLIARYQSPLPLPPNAKPSSSSDSNHQRTASAEPSSSHRPVPPVPGLSSSLSSSPVLPPVPPKSPNQSPSLSPSLSPSPPFTASAESLPRSRTPIDSSRLQALRQAEAEAARRKEQEEKDLELARLLDLEESKREERELREKVERLEREKKERLEREKKERLERLEREKKEEHTSKVNKGSQDTERVTAERRKAREEKIGREEERDKATAKREPSPPAYVKAEVLRKTQEEKDMELAMQLDRELNL